MHNKYNIQIHALSSLGFCSSKSLGFNCLGLLLLFCISHFCKNDLSEDITPRHSA